MKFFEDLSLSTFTAGFVAVLVGFTSSVAIVFQETLAFGASPAIIASWMWALGLGMGYAAFRALRDHLREVHPLVWGVATELPSALPPAQSDVSRGGRIEALVRIARHYERDLTTGARVILGENGVKLEYPLGDK